MSTAGGTSATGVLTGATEVLTGDARTVLATLPAGSVQACVTSPPYFGLRDYGHAGQIGLEQSPGEYVAGLVSLFREVRRILADDGTLWLNLGDSYASPWPCSRRNKVGAGSLPDGKRASRPPRMGDGLKDKDLMMIPARVAIALQADGWWLRSDIIWHKPNPMPEGNVRDRPTSAHEHVFLFSKRARYRYDPAAIAEPSVMRPQRRLTPREANPDAKVHGQREHRRPPGGTGGGLRNARNVWTIAPQPFPGAHFAVMPLELARRCILAGSRPGDLVLDPFGGVGTTGLAAQQLGRRAALVELNPDYAAMARARILSDPAAPVQVAA